MVLLRDFEGGVYTFKSNSECLDLGIPTPVLPEKVRGHMVLVLGGVPRKLDYVKVMTITSTLKEDGDYVPIAPTLKNGYTIQLQLRNYLVWHHRETLRFFPVLQKYSYLKIDSYYEVPIQMLVNVRDHFNNAFVIRSKGQGGLRQLQDYVRRRDLIRTTESHDAGPSSMIQSDEK
ncbi:hypothetical protein LHYA1_G001206 [Lachnellula hyalina]|uniref:Uncharacterized protein n=1 Tax=Lachnellula hyalina TaxID=1316788 RepID=A0A8H8RC39_9HELO|nr:uncharacterized protein LHYA1_G001206 [Lachnellula hyalina]TVY30621.1 hypothetical protein LHYA1_G001206 [Lachnellula hyalina]